MVNFGEEKRWFVERNPAYRSGLRLYVFLGHTSPNSKTYQSAIDFQTVELKESERPEQCLTLLPPREAQQLMDELYAAGVRPSEGQGSAGAMKATERHLEDMRSLVFEGMRIKKK